MTDFTTERLREIDATAQETFDLASREAAKKKEGSRRRAYEKTITEVRRIAGKPQARELTEWIQDRIRTKRRLPSGRQVRREGARICRESGHEVSTGSWLGA